MEPMNLGSPGRPATSLYLSLFLMEEPQTPTSPPVSRDLSFGFTNSPFGVTSATQDYSARSALGQKTLFARYQQTPTWGRNASNYIGTPAQNPNTSITGPPSSNAITYAAIEHTAIICRNVVRRISGMQQQQLVNLTGPVRHSLLNNNPSQAMQCEAELRYKGFWVTVYGFPFTAISTILQHFSQCGSIMDTTVSLEKAIDNTSTAAIAGDVKISCQ
uniref:Nucleoporin NUP35 n=1 Tax=Glossina austeni TaxID=7395 RepID=A0A1A9VRL5_GLOAU